MEDLQGSRILITGGAGFVGSHIMDQLLVENISEVILLDNFVRGNEGNVRHALSSGKVKLIEGDIRDEKLLEHLVDGIDYCFHMAALRINHCVEEPKHAFEVMFAGTFNLTELCIKHNVKKLILASSASIYGGAECFPTNECHHPYNNRTLYGVAKTANEGMLRAFHDMSGLKYNALRFFNIYGPRMDTHGRYTEVLIRWYHLIKNHKRPVIYGDGKQTMDFIFVEDVARANVLALKADVNDEVYNIASGVETSLEALCYLLLEVMGSDIKPEHVPIPGQRKKVEVMRRLADTSKASEQIGFKSEVPLNIGLKKLCTWLDHQSCCDRQFVPLDPVENLMESRI